MLFIKRGLFFRILQYNGLSAEDLNENLNVVYGNTVKSMFMILKAMNVLKLRFVQPERELDAIEINKLINESNHDLFLSKSQFLEISATLKILWNDEGVRMCMKQCTKRANEFYINDSAE